MIQKNWSGLTMNKSIEEKLIGTLLDKYERSSFFKAGTIPTKRILLKLYEEGKCEFSEYNIENSDQRICINESVQALAKRNLVYFEWMKGEENHIISKIWINIEKLPESYEFVHRQPQNDFLSEVFVELAAYMEHIQAQWINDFLQDICEYMEQKRKLHSLIPESAQERKALLQALKYIDANGNKELLKRVFSIRCFGDSKLFERVVEARLLRILKKYLDSDDHETDEQLLNQIGIVKYPEQFEFCGVLILTFPNGECVDFANLCCGTIYGQDIETAQIGISKDVNCILSIENKTNYFDYIYKTRKQDELVIYHGGQYSPAKRAFFKAVADASSELSWFHWGDIDYGGFSMLMRLRREINSKIQPYRMDKQELLEFAPFTTSFSPEYAMRLQKLMKNPELNDCSECLSYMVKNVVRLEQEAMLE